MRGKKNIPEDLWNLISSHDNDMTVLDSYSKEELRVMKEYFFHIKFQSSKEQPDWNNMWANIENKAYQSSKKIKVLYVSLRYVAVLIVLLGISFLMYEIVDTISSDFVDGGFTESSIEPGAKSAKLILASGESINLTKSNIGEILENNDVIISNDSTDLLAYKQKNIASSKLEYNTILVPRAGEYSVRLSDGTYVFLNSETEFKYPVNFIGNERRVFLNGEAYFRVKKDATKPFRVQLDNMSVEVLGTSFNINSYVEKEGVQTTLVEGKVKVFKNDDNTKSVILKPSQQAEFRNNKLSVKDVDVAEYVSWKDGRFHFKNMSLENVMIQMERWYDIEVFYINQEVKDYPFTGVINKMQMAEEIFEIVEKVTGLKIRKKGKIIYIEKR